MAKVSKATNVSVKHLGNNEFDIVFPKQKLDCHLRWEDGGWWLHVFKSNVKNPNRAFVESTPIMGRKKSPNWNDLFEYTEAFTK